MDEKLKIEIQKMLESNPNDSIDELNKKIKIIVDNYNFTVQDMFEGLSPETMSSLLYDEWGKNIISINPQKHDGNDIPIIKQIKFFIDIIKDTQEIKLTKIGNLPPAIVKEIYNQGFISDASIESGIVRITKETDVENIVTMRYLCQLAGLTRKMNNKIVLIKSAIKKISSNEFFNIIFETAFKKYNWAYRDGYQNDAVGQFGSNYSLYLLNKYGDKWEEDKFYARLYFKAFEKLKSEDRYALSDEGYSRRTFNQIFRYFGFIEYENKRWDEGNIRATDLFKKYIKIEM